MKKEKKYSNFLRAVNHYVVFFGLVAFIVTTCIMLFFEMFLTTQDIVLTGENLNFAAKLTFLNVLFLSFLFTVFDAFRRKRTIDRPVQNIIEAAGKIMQGDFNARVKTEAHFAGDSRFDEVIACINKMAEELSGVETLRTDFITNVSHEMKTPLAVIQNYGTLLQTPGLSEEKRVEYAKGITDSSRRLTDMMTNILKLNRLENQKIYPQTTEYNLGEQLCECLLQYENVWEKAEIEIETDIEENVMIKADSELLSLVWNNLFSNAFKFTEHGGKVTVTLEATEHHAYVRVKDTGCGMSPEVGAHIFEKFYQGDTSRAMQGNGLGLALVKRVIDITRGEIGVESVRGEGTTFSVRIRRS